MADAPVDAAVEVALLDTDTPSTTAPTMHDARDLTSGKDVTTRNASKKGKQQDPSSEFVNVLSTRIDEIERAVSAGHGSPAEREAAKARKKALREVVKFCSDKANSTEDRITFVQNKYTQMLSELLRMERTSLELQNQNELLTKEKDKAQSELKRTNLLKDKLEELCRQLQKEAREVADDSRRRNEEDTRQRLDLQAKFTKAINEVTEKMDLQASERARQLNENDELRGKLDGFLAQFESFNTLVQKKDIELQLATARAEQAAALAAQQQARLELLQGANDKYVAAIETLKPELSELESLRARNALLVGAKEGLQGQLEHYASKFGEFQDTLSKSNETFVNLREQMELSAKQRTSLAKERDEARRRAEQCDHAIVQLLEDRQSLKKQVEVLQGKLNGGAGGDEELRRVKAQKEKLEGLCRLLQQQVREAKAAGGGGDAGATGAPGVAEPEPERSVADAAAEEDEGEAGAAGSAAATAGGGPAASAQGPAPPEDAGGALAQQQEQQQLEEAGRGPSPPPPQAAAADGEAGGAVDGGGGSISLPSDLY